ncbi:hypothetical protein QR680_012738 [Steinernema hermaphroditum]|uniref:Uncharacterized protein n=1 Tax=Steinernema hermaphroditum TaxID=289476 RepID=A0AA39I5B9_9BILA|nr:hypothetical protein QR680_012738 [Steinernema hermaphroditum]
MEKSSKNERTRLGQKLKPADDHLVDGSDSGDLKRKWEPADDHLVDGSDNGHLFEKKIRRDESEVKEDYMDDDEDVSDNDSSLEKEHIEVQNCKASHRVDDQEITNRTRTRLRELVYISSERHKTYSSIFENECAELPLDYLEFLNKMRSVIVRALNKKLNTANASIHILPKRTCEQDHCFNFRHYAFRVENVTSLLDVWQFIIEKKKKSMSSAMLHQLQLLAQLIYWDFSISEDTCDALRKIMSNERNECFYDHRIIAALPTFTFNFMAAACAEDLRFLRFKSATMGQWCRRSQKACLNLQHWRFPKHIFLNAFTPDHKDESNHGQNPQQNFGESPS